MVSEEVCKAGGGGNILDIGCSTGALGRALRSKYDVKMSGIEFFPDAAHVSRNWYENVYEIDLEQVIRGELDLTNIIRIGQRFDYIIMGDILEHLSCPEKVLEEVILILNPVGRLFVSLPNVAYWPIRLRLLSGDFAYTTDGLFWRTASGILHRDHLKFYTLRSAKDLVIRSGFRILELRNNNGTRPMRFLGKYWPSLLAFQFVMKCNYMGR